MAFFSSDNLDYAHFMDSIDDLPINMHVVWHNLKMWVVLLNPAHRIKDLSEKVDTYPSVVYLFDLLSRVVVSYFLFQMISAFRKFSK